MSAKAKRAQLRAKLESRICNVANCGKQAAVIFRDASTGVVIGQLCRPCRAVLEDARRRDREDRLARLAAGVAAASPAENG